MADAGHEKTEEILKDIEKRLKREYKQAVEEVQAKLDDYLEKFEIKDKTWQRWVDEGKKTEEEYQQWRVGQIAIGERWEEMRDSLAEDYHNANLIAKSIVDGYMPEVYALNHNYGTYQIEHDAKVNTSYTLYDRQTAERLMRDNPQLLPNPGKKLSKRIANGLDVRWNRQQIQSVMMQSLLQGESIPKIAQRLADKVGDSNYKAAIRNARTMATCAQNAGRIDSYKRAQEMGIENEKQWLATLDGRTRHSHRAIDHETQPIEEKFSNGCLYPCDPSGDPSEVWNCRCTLRSIVKGLQPQAYKYRDLSDIGGDYDEWKNSKEKPDSNPIDLPVKKANAIKNSYIKKYREI